MQISHVLEVLGCETTDAAEHVAFQPARRDTTAASGDTLRGVY